MSSALTPQNLKDSADLAAPGAPAIELDQIQGDVLIGLQKKFERFVFFQIVDVPGFKDLLGNRLGRRITTTRTVQLREFRLRDYKAQGKTDPLPLVGVNLGFNNDGIGLLIPGAALGDASFTTGAKAKAAALGDPVDASSNPTTWLPTFLGATIHGVFLITGGTQSAVDGEAAELLAILGATVAVSYDETANVRPGLEAGHEHFGWLDGVSQPAVAGLSDPFPGQREIDPGFFAFGYGPTATPPLPWMANGSFMVFRRLRQLVPEFTSYLLTQAVTQGMDPVLLGARLVGRWKSGAPMSLTPAQDDTTLGPDPQRNNNFDNSDDQAQRRCPYGAHIRKTNPRQDLTPQETKVDIRRIMRAGIPFGPEVTPAEASSSTSALDRGLMFVCYQTSIPNQFEFLQIAWANNPGFIPGRNHPDGSPVTVGFDPIIGQNSAPGRARTTDEPVPNYPTGNIRSTLNEPIDFIIPTAAGYFFMPSIEAMENELSA